MARLLLLNKPFDVLSQFTDRGSPAGRSTLSDFIAVKGVYPAGRLDRDSEGLLLLCDDGRLQARIADPRFKMPKTYLVQVEGDPQEPELERLRRGVPLKDGMTLPAEVARIDAPIDGNRIAAIGPTGSIAAPPGTTVRNVAGTTILPGFVDVHDHVATVRRDVLGLEDWGLRARLAAGVTTSFDPSTLTIDMFAYQDLLDAGLMLGPRLPSTGTALFSWNRLGSLDDALALERRYRDFYRTRNLKQYRIGSRLQRQWTVMAAAQLGMMPTCEGALALKLDLTQIIDGFSGNEHSLATPLYRDVIELLARSGTSNDTTLQITNGGYPAQDYFITREDPLTDAGFRYVTPPFAADQIARHRDWRSLSDYLFPRIAADSDRMQKAGGLLSVGAHGEVPGLGFHYELQACAMGGMASLDILRAATIGGAETIGRRARF